MVKPDLEESNFVEFPVTGLSPYYKNNAPKAQFAVNEVPLPDPPDTLLQDFHEKLIQDIAAALALQTDKMMMGVDLANANDVSKTLQYTPPEKWRVFFPGMGKAGFHTLRYFLTIHGYSNVTFSRDSSVEFYDVPLGVYMHVLRSETGPILKLIMKELPEHWKEWRRVPGE